MFVCVSNCVRSLNLKRRRPRPEVKKKYFFGSEGSEDTAAFRV